MIGIGTPSAQSRIMGRTFPARPVTALSFVFLVGVSMLRDARTAPIAA